MKEHTEMHWSMADVAGKTPSRRVAIAGGRIDLGREAFELLQAGRLPKGDPLAMAEIAGIQAAKQTPALLPLCHPIGLNRVRLYSWLRPEAQAVDMFCVADTVARTGVEMEALTAASVALLTVWDLVKPINPALEIGGVRLLYKAGGKQGVWIHPAGLPSEVEALVEDLG